jgi:hypothetical protein
MARNARALNDTIGFARKQRPTLGNLRHEGMASKLSQWAYHGGKRLSGANLSGAGQTQ